MTAVAWRFLEQERVDVMITLLKMVQEQLAAGENRFRAAFANAAVGMSLLEPDGRFVFVNPALCAFTGYSEGELTALTLLSVMHPDDRNDGDKEMRRLLAGRVDRLVLEKRYVKQGGGVAWARTSISLVPAEGMGTDQIVALFEDITERKLADELLAHQALHDPLTGLPIRALLCQWIEAAAAECRTRDSMAALLLIDLDRFKDINDSFGHRFGDLVLNRLTPRLGTGLREIDRVARLGGDEFAIFLPEADREAAVLVAQRALVNLSRPIEVNGHRLDVGASIGIALFPEHGHDAETLLRRADVAMYSAKRSRAGHAVYADGQSHSSPRRLELVAELRQGIEDGQLQLHYQPKIDLKTGQVVGAEALVRWRHPRD